jgi:hypothetical protein
MDLVAISGRRLQPRSVRLADFFCTFSGRWAAVGYFSAWAGHHAGRTRENLMNKRNILILGVIASAALAATTVWAQSGKTDASKASASSQSAEPQSDADKKAQRRAQNEAAAAARKAKGGDAGNSGREEEEEERKKP